MRIASVPQWNFNGNRLRRFGDVLNDALSDPTFSEFKFAVAYMRRSGLDRIMPGIESLVGRGGSIAGAVGIDDGITSADALEDLEHVSAASTIVSYGGAPIAHPKLFLFTGPQDGRLVVGSANLTRDGLYRNIEYGVDLSFDLRDPRDRTEFAGLVKDVDSLLTVGGNSQRLDVALIGMLELAGTVSREGATRDPGRPPRRPRATMPVGGLPFPLPTLPAPPPGIARRAAARVVIGAPVVATTAAVFVMQLSAFDSSHRTGVPGTPDVLIPNDAMPFFPPPGPHGRTYDDAYFKVVLNHPDGPELHTYRIWIYTVRTENRLTMGHRTIDLTTPAGGDLFVVSRIDSPDADFEITIAKPGSANFAYYSALCNRTSNGKSWGLI